MEGEAVDLQDWEVLQKSEDDAPVTDSGSFVGIGVDTDGVLRPDYFSLDGQKRYVKNVAEEGDVSEEGSVESDNPSWVDPALETTAYKRKNSSEFWSDSSSDRSEERKVRDFDSTSELGLAEITKSRLSSEEGIGKTEAENKKFGGLGSCDLDVKKESNVFGDGQVSLQDSPEIHMQNESLEKCFSDSGGDDLVSDLGNYNNVKIPETSESSGGLDGGMNSKELIEKEECSVESKNLQVAELKSDLNAGGDGEKRAIVWWKVPLEVLKYCVFRVNPVWSFSVAAAFMGFIILGRRLYKMKRKSQGLKLKVTVDDKKVSQFMSRAARLNEAFSVVRRVPVIRPSLPAPGMTPWIVMSMR